ncbi:MAG TPA: SpoIIE family protein phosphatase, partial [bacterium]
DLERGIAGWVAKHKQPLLIADCYEDARFDPKYDRQTKFKTKAMICVPLIRKRQLLGVIQVINKVDGSVFDDDDLMIFETLAAQCAIAIENTKLVELQVESEALERELNTARDIQQALLPSALPKYDDMDIAANLIPARQVGGDYYNVVRINKNESLFFIADVTGKGIPAALIVSTIDSCLNTYLRMKQVKFDLMTFVIGLNEILIESTTFDKFATCWFGLYRHTTKKLLSINAGHNPPYVFNKDNGVPRELKQGGLFLGGVVMPYESEEIQLKKDDVLVFFSDGVTEAWNEKEEEYEERRLIDIVKRQLNEKASQILVAIERDVSQHVGKAQQSDDFTCAVVKILQ